MKGKESAANAELQDIKAKYQRRIQQLQERGPSMSQAEGEAAQREVAKMDNGLSYKGSTVAGQSAEPADGHD